MSAQERKLDAAEYVIGTLSGVERTAFEASIESDQTTRNDVLFWERTFGVLNASISPEEVPTGMWSRIEAALPPVDNSSGNDRPTAAQSLWSPLGATNDNVSDKLRRKLGRWRTVAIVAILAATIMGVYILNGPANPFLQ